LEDSEEHQSRIAGLIPLNDIPDAYDKYREQLSGILGDERFQRLRDYHIGMGEEYGALDRAILSDAMNAGTASAQRSRRLLAAEDARDGLSRIIDGQLLRNRASGIGGGTPLDPAMMARAGHLAGAQINQAGEAERLLGIDLRRGLQGQSNLAQARAYEALNAPAGISREIAGSYGLQGTAVDAAQAPIIRNFQNVQNAITTLGRSSGTLHDAQLQNFALTQLNQQAKPSWTDKFSQFQGIFGDARRLWNSFTPSADPGYNPHTR